MAPNGTKWHQMAPEYTPTTVYSVRWNTWEPEENILDKRLIFAYEDEATAATRSVKLMNKYTNTHVQLMQVQCQMLEA